MVLFCVLSVASDLEGSRFCGTWKHKSFPALDSFDSENTQTEGKRETKPLACTVVEGPTFISGKNQVCGRHSQALIIGRKSRRTHRILCQDPTKNKNVVWIIFCIVPSKRHAEPEDKETRFTVVLCQTTKNGFLCKKRVCGKRHTEQRFVTIKTFRTKNRNVFSQTRNCVLSCLH